MKRQFASFECVDVSLFHKKLLAWSDSFDQASFLDSNKYTHVPYYAEGVICGVGAIEVVSVKRGEKGSNAFGLMKEMYDLSPDWWFGYWGYDLKNEVEDLVSENLDAAGLDDMCFFRPKHVVMIEGEEVKIYSVEAPNTVFEAINLMQIEEVTESASIELTPRVAKERYLEVIQQLKQHIYEGDLYEVNYCTEWYAEEVSIHPKQVFARLNALSKAPFAGYFKSNHQFLMCGSPERFLKKDGDKLISQPIKGTRKRGCNEAEDLVLIQDLKTNEKDRAENVMIVDLVRNDLTRVSQTRTIAVEELFGVYTFEQVHQMISTITSTVREDVHWVDAIRAAFPMGSMTGAPKVISMELIEKYEDFKRGLYSGALGYVSPTGNFDFNVVIRSLVYNANKSYLSASVGGAIVYDSVPEEEYEECLTKASSMFKTLA